MPVVEWIRWRLLKNVDQTPVGDKAERLDALRVSEWSPSFEQAMRNRLLMGRFRYGRLARTEDRDYDRIGSALRRLRGYQETGNLECLVDVANLCLVEFEHSTHPRKHFQAVDDGEHVVRG